MKCLLMSRISRGDDKLNSRIIEVLIYVVAIIFMLELMYVIKL